MTLDPDFKVTLLFDAEFQSPTVRTAKEWQNACVEEPTARNLN